MEKPLPFACLKMAKRQAWFRGEVEQITWPSISKTSKTEVLQTPSAIKSKPRSGGRVVKVFEFLKKIEFQKSFNYLVLIFRYFLEFLKIFEFLKKLDFFEFFL